MNAIGDMARQLILSTNQTNLKTQLDDLAIQVSTGVTHDVNEHLNGDTSLLLSINRSLENIEAYEQNIVEAGIVANMMQTSLEIMQTASQETADALINADMTPDTSLLTDLASDAEDSLDIIMGELNRSLSERYLYSGTATNTAAVYSTEELLDDLTDHVSTSGAVTVEEILSEVEDFFSEAGFYDTNSYSGSIDSISSIPISETDSVSIDITATHEDIKSLLIPLSMAAISMDGSLGIDINTQMDVLRESGEDLYGVQTNITSLRASLGMVEARIEEASVRNESEKSAISLAKVELIGIDSYEASVEYENASVQLEMLYAITSRSSSLNLVNFL